MNKPALRVAIEGQITSGEASTEQALIGLCYGFNNLEIADDDEYIVVGPSRKEKWLLPYVGRRVQYVSAPRTREQVVDDLKNLFGPMRGPLGIVRRRLRRVVLGRENSQTSFGLPISNGFYESLRPNVLHITYPLKYVRSSIPTIITMHDLQHRHLPEFFSRSHMEWRESTYPAMLELARAVITVSRFCKDDIISQYGVPASKIYVIPHASATEAYRPASATTMQSTRHKYKLPQIFMLYPAMTCGHKNHLRLLEAIALLRAEGRRVSLVCTGGQLHHWPLIQQKMKELRIEDDVRFTGFVEASELADIYELAQFVIFPSLFEGAGLPLLEAFRAKKALACSDISAFREYGGDAPLFFNPFEPRSIADAITIMTDCAEIRATIASRGAQRGGEFTWRRAALLHRAVYRKAAGLKLLPEEDELLRSA